MKPPATSEDAHRLISEERYQPGRAREADDIDGPNSGGGEAGPRPIPPIEGEGDFEARVCNAALGPGLPPAPPSAASPAKKPNGEGDFEARIGPDLPQDDCGAGDEPIKWSEPKAIPDGLLPVPPFDLAFLPKKISPWVADIADLMQCPPDFVAIPAMITLASAIGRKIAIRPQCNTDWTEVANLWGYIVGPPGSMKSPAMAEAMKPLRRLEANARSMNETALKAYQTAADDFKIRSEAAKSALKAALKKDPNATAPAPLEEPVEPKARRYVVDDATYEALGVILVDNPQGVLAYRDELVSLLRTLDREEYAAARGFFLAAWGGLAGYTFDRIIRGTQHIEAACVSSSALPSRPRSPISSSARSMAPKATTG